MSYRGRALGADTELHIEREGIRIGSRFLDYADVKTIIPMNHRVLVDTLDGEQIEISMLGFSYDGFWEELSGSFTARTLEALFVEGTPIMSVEGEYETPEEKGRARIDLYPDSVCILPPTCGAVRIPLCFIREIRLDGYLINITSNDGTNYVVGRMGYDTIPFAERAQKAADKIKKERAALLAKLKLTPPFAHIGLFRTTTPELYWQAGFGKGCCAVELFTQEDAATYLYRFSEPQSVFTLRLEEALEAMGPHREIIYWTDEQLNQKSLYRMAAARCGAVRYLRARADGRLIHNQTHSDRLAEFLA
ncbi:MAG: hypothetical protein K5756_09600 [Clostridiales bacterium]|nr:hypothetical protein [Clostridiales bacterium]